MLGFNALGRLALGEAGQRAPSDYELAIEAGSFALTGQDVELSRTWAIPAGAAAFSLTGQAVGTRADRKVAVGAGAFSLTGQAVGIRAARRMSAAAASFSLSGQAVALKKSWLNLTVGAGALSLAGQAVSLRQGFLFPVDAGAFSLSGQTVGIRATRFILASPDVAPKRRHILAASLGGVAFGQGSSAGVGSTTTFGLAGQSVRIIRSYTPLEAGAAAFAATGFSVDLRHHRVLFPDVGVLALNGIDVAILATRIMPVAAGAFVLSAADIDPLFHRHKIVMRAGGGTPIRATASGGPQVKTKASGSTRIFGKVS